MRQVREQVRNLTIDNMVHNLTQYVECATDAQFDEGKTWYISARCTAKSLANEYGLTLVQTSGIIAALSPRNNWDRNLIDAQAVLNCYRENGNIDSVKTSTYGANKIKAWRIANGESPIDVLGGDKVCAFYDNILNAECLDSQVTVDVWAARAAVAEMGTKNELNIDSSLYDKVRQAYQAVASKIGITAKQLQAVIWVVIRDLTSGIRKELEHNTVMFCPNCGKVFGHDFVT